MILNRLTSKDDQEEWLRIRKRYLTGTDAGAVCGMNPYKSAIQVYLDKTTPDIELEDNEAMRLGRDMEDYVAERFMEATRKKVRRSNAMYVSDRYPFMMANVDRLVVGENAGLECKTASPYTANRWKDGRCRNGIIFNVSIIWRRWKRRLVSGGADLRERIPVYLHGTG